FLSRLASNSFARKTRHFCWQVDEVAGLVDIRKWRQTVYSQPQGFSALTGQGQHICCTPGDILEKLTMTLVQTEQHITTIQCRDHHHLRCFQGRNSDEQNFNS